MLVRPASLAFLSLSFASVLADDDPRGFRGLKTNGEGGKGKGQGKGQGKGDSPISPPNESLAPDIVEELSSRPEDDTPASNLDHGTGIVGVDDHLDEPHPARSSKGQVIIKRKTEKKMKKEGKSKNEIAQARAKGLDKINKNKIVFESLGEGAGFHVVEVGRGREKKFMQDLLNDDTEGLFEYVQENYEVYPDLRPNDLHYGYQYHHDLMQSELAWDFTTGSTAVTIGICDTGLQLDHPDLAENRLPGYHATRRCWEDDPNCEADVSPVHQHGTNCAGCAAALGNNVEGLVGMGWNFFHRPGRVTDHERGYADSATLADCAMRMCEKPDVKVVSVSYSSPEEETRRDAATYCKEQGSLMVNSAGNDRRDLSEFGEADDDDLIVVGASDHFDDKAGFSAFGRYVDVWAPGVRIWTASLQGTYDHVQGTSFSCPLVAGLIGLIWSQNPQLTPNEVERIVKDTAEDGGENGIATVYNTPYGRVNAYQSLLAAGHGNPFPTQSPTTSKPTSSPTQCTDDMCDDNNICTVDTCDPLQEPNERICLNTIIEGCCGNFICEPTFGETERNCDQDCSTGPFSISTPWSDDSVCPPEPYCIVTNGIMFDVVSKYRVIHVRALRAYVRTSGDIEVWTRPGTHVGHTVSSEGWTKVAEHHYEWAHIDDWIEVPESSFTQAVEVPAYGRQAFYVVIHEGGYNFPRLYTYGRTGATTDWIAKEDHDLIVHHGQSSGMWFRGSRYGTARIFLGELTYTAMHNGPTPLPTAAPTNLPTTGTPSTSPTSSPTISPTVSVEPTEFVPGTDELITGFSYRSLKSLYFDVQGGSIPAKITDIGVHTYRTTHLRVYSKVGNAAPYEQTPCAWKLVAETRPDWNGGMSGSRLVYPEWNSNGFEPVIIPPNSTVAFYVTNVGSSDKIFVIRGGYGTDAFGAYEEHVSLSPDSPVGAVSISTGRDGHEDGDLFRLSQPMYSWQTTTYYGFAGALKVETVQPGTDLSPPTMAPTSPFQFGSLESPLSGSDLDFKGLQFDVSNLHTLPITVRQISVRFSSAGTHPVEVWMKNGSHQGTDGSCDNWNNWCNTWTKVYDSFVVSTSAEEFTSTGTFIAKIEASASAAFAIVTGSDAIVTKDGSDIVQNGDLRIDPASPIQDYYADNVQSRFPVASPSKIFQGVITYEVVSSACAVLSQADWVVLDPNPN